MIVTANRNRFMEKYFDGLVPWMREDIDQMISFGACLAGGSLRRSIKKGSLQRVFEGTKKEKLTKRVLNSLFTKAEPSKLIDLDFFPRDDGCARKCREYLLVRYGASWKDSKYSVTFMPSKNHNFAYQIVHKDFRGTNTEATLSLFDFVNCQLALDDKFFYHHKDFRECEAKGILRIERCGKAKFGWIDRLAKYIDKPEYETVEGITHIRDAMEELDLMFQAHYRQLSADFTNPIFLESLNIYRTIFKKLSMHDLTYLFLINGVFDKLITQEIKRRKKEFTQYENSALI